MNRQEAKPQFDAGDALPPSAVGRQRPLKTGLRFSKKALSASWLSSVALASACMEAASSSSSLNERGAGSCGAAMVGVLERDEEREDPWRIRGAGKLDRQALSFLRALWGEAYLRFEKVYFQLEPQAIIARI